MRFPIEVLLSTQFDVQSYAFFYYQPNIKPIIIAIC